MTFVMLIGLPGSGKSMHASCPQCLAPAGKPVRYTVSDNAIVLSSDAIRKELYGSEEIQKDPRKVFDLMNSRAVAAAKNGQDVIYDATNLRRRNRAHILSQLPANCTKVALVIWARYETCVYRDANRSRSVGRDVIDKMIREFQPPFFDEGWDEIHTLHNDSRLYNNDDLTSWLNIAHDNPHHNNTVKEHTDKVVYEFLRSKAYAGDRAVGKTFSAELLSALYLAANFHDIGKSFVKDFKDARGHQTNIAHFYEHQNVGSYFALGLKPFLNAAKSDSITLLTAWLINAHMEPFFNSKYYRNLDLKWKSLVDVLHKCDVKGA